MIKKSIPICLLLLALCCISAHAAVSDFEITIDQTQFTDLSLGDVGQFSITLTNHGPDVGGNGRPLSALASLEVEHESGVPVDFIQNNSIPQACDFRTSVIDPRPPNPVAFGYQFFYPPMAAGESITCYGFFIINFETGVREIEWKHTFGLLSINNEDIDTNPNNDITTMLFGIEPTAVPTLSVTGLMALLILTLFSCFLVHGRKAF